jgi:trimeric autotransporter adhesin
VTGAGAGTATISYTNAAGCSRTTVVTVSAPLAANTGDNIVCVGQTIALTNATTGGTWASSTTAKATVGYYTGIVTGVAVGTSNITYKVPSGCLSITQVTVNAAPAAITGTTSVCVGQTITLTHGTTGGSWSTTSATASVDASGVVTGISAGYAYITYTLSSGCFKVATIIVRALPLSIAGASSGTIGAYVILTNSTSGGVWSTDDAAIASMPYSSLGYVYGVSAGSTTITYRITSTGCFVTHPISIYSTGARPTIKTSTDNQASAFSVFPNPTSGALSITADVDGEFTLFTLDGKMVQLYPVTAGNNSVSLPNNLASGVYMCRFNGNDGSMNMVRLVVEK